MITEQELKKAVEAILMEMGGGAIPSKPSIVSNGKVSQSNGKGSPTSADNSGGEGLPDLGAADLQELIYVPKPEDKDALKVLRKSTPARVAVWRTGPRYLTETLLRFRADHAVAMDAVFTEISEDWINEHKLPLFVTKCENKDIFLTRPDLGQQFEDEEAKKIKACVGSSNRIVVYIADGLSTTAVTTNAMDTYKAIADGLNRHNLKISAPFFVQYARVGTEDAISEITGAEVVCVLIGERPGLLTAESMSAYIAYKATVNMPEARRTVVSNIHRRGTPAVEAGGYVADIIKMMLDKKVSGLDLKL